ncbi:hypothetical protein [Streptomyces sp. NPDC059455]|uniref:hypothetical protein n=1 Tax=Streptomyces sp. NPDC059455 TaxID=3346837 RepID=UPI0036A664D2
MVNFLDDRTQAKRLAQVLDGLDRRLQALERSTQVGYTSIEGGGSLDIYDEDGVLKGSVGVQPDGGVALVPVNSTPPPIPTAPAVESVLAGLLVGWDGEWDDAYATPSDFSLIQVHVGSAADFVPTVTTQVATITAPLGGTVTVAVEGYAPVWVRLVAANTAAFTGQASGAVQGTPRQAVPGDLIDGIVTDIKIAENAVTEAKIALGAVTAPKLLAESVTTEKLVALAVTAEKIAAWAITTDKLSALAVTADKLDVNSVTATKIAAGAIEATHIKAGSITADKLSADAINGAVVTGAIVQTAASGRRLVLNPSQPALEIFSGSSSEVDPGRVRADVLNVGAWLQPEVLVESPLVGSARATMTLRSPEPNGRGWARLEPSNQLDGHAHITVQNGGPNDEAEVMLYGAQGSKVGSSSHSVAIRGSGITIYGGSRQVTITEGVLEAPNIAHGTVNIVPTPGKPTPLTVTGLSIAGKAPFRAQVTPITQVPGTTVTGVSASGITATGLTVWVTRTNDTQTTLHWLVIGS